MKYQFTILHNEHCNFWRVLKASLEHFVRERKLDAEIKEILIWNDEEARQYQFSGSPQLLMNGKDIDPMADRITFYHAGGCRPVFFRGGHYDYPPMAMVEEALQLGE